MVDNELSDFLPLMLQFLQVADFKMIVEHRKPSTCHYDY